MNGFYNYYDGKFVEEVCVVIPLRMNGFYNIPVHDTTVVVEVVIPLRMNGFYNRELETLVKNYELSYRSE